MPNWCDNVVMIKGEKQEVIKVKELLQNEGNVFSFQKISPCPEALLHTTAPAVYHNEPQKVEFNRKKYGAADWYDWKNANWGTKWDASDAILSSELGNDSEYQVAYSFQTAWAPPIPVYEKLAEMFPNTNIFVNFDESGMGFSGWKFYSDGDLQNETDYESSFHSIRTYMEPDTDVWEWLE